MSTSLSELCPGTVIAAGQRRVTQRAISDFSVRYSAWGLPPVGSARRKRRKAEEDHANPWMICAIAEQLVSAAIAERSLIRGPMLVEKVAWPGPVIPGEEVKLRIEVLEACPSMPLESVQLRWRWVVTTTRETEALDLVSLTHLRLWQRESVQKVTTAGQRMAYKVPQASALVGVSKHALYDAIRKERLPAYRPKPRAHLLILAEDLKAWVISYKV